MRVAVVADLHGRRGAWRRVMSDVERRGADRVVLLGDYLEAKVSKRNHDPSRRWELADVVRPDPGLWQQLGDHDLVRGNQEERIRDLLRDDQVDDALGRLLDAPPSRMVGDARLIHGHQLDWYLFDENAWYPDLSAVPPIPLLLAGHSHQVRLLEVSPDGAVAGHRPKPVTPGRPVETDGRERLFVNLGAARGKPSHWLRLDLGSAPADSAGPCGPTDVRVEALTFFDAT